MGLEIEEGSETRTVMKELQENLVVLLLFFVTVVAVVVLLWTQQSYSILLVQGTCLY